VLVSDDRSPDDSNQVIPPLLQKSGVPFSYYSQDKNLGYDGNVRFCLAHAHGRYVMLLGNDDALAGPNTLSRIRQALNEVGDPDVAFVNFEDWSDPSAVVRRAVSTRSLGTGPDVSIRFFRSFSFVSGLIFRQALCVEHETDRWDQSIYYQIYIACRLIAAGARLAALDIVALRKDVRIDGATVVNYATKVAGARWSLDARHTGLESVIRVTQDAVLPYLPPEQRSAALRRIINQVYMVTYAFWLFEYRRVGNWSLSAGVARGLWPGRLLGEYPQLSPLDRLRVWQTYAAVSAAGLSLPAGLFERHRVRLAALIRRLQQKSAGI
jgi:glycosyltransferase involved in cell wall biosynthesis